MARLLREAGKTVVAWAELDRPNILDRLRTEGNCAALVLHDADPACNNLEGALSEACTLAGLPREWQRSPTAAGTPGQNSKRILSRARKAQPTGNVRR